jgi:uncharacterized membrane protein
MSSIPRWAQLSSLILAIAGLGVAGYLTIAHYTTSSILACGGSGLVNCELVTTSAQSRFFGIPVALLGLLWFVAMTALCLPAAWRSSDRRVHGIRLLAATLGIGFVLWLVYAELIIIGAVCLWCTVVHVIAFGLFAISVWAYSYS